LLGVDEIRDAGQDPCDAVTELVFRNPILTGEPRVEYAV
jgi:hypothetical protein